jgi:hypothetical protein
VSRTIDFHVGQRVRLTEKGVQQRLQGHAKTRMGTVRRIDPDAVFRIFVQRDGLKGVDSYHCDFWEPADDRP